MNKVIIIIIVVAVLVAGVTLILINFYNLPTTTPALTPKPATTNPPTVSSNVLDRIETAIRGKLKR